MAHDFAKQRPASHSSRRTQGAARRRQEPSAGSHWSWFFTGLLCGLFVAFVGYLGVLKPTPAEEVAAAEEAAPDNPLARAVFDFYQYLPQAEVSVDVEPVAVEPEETPAPVTAAREQPATEPTPQTREGSAAPTQVAVVQAPRDERGDVQYLLQAGSFQAREDAEALRASIILMNLQANVVPGTVAGRTWHRVQVGPFNGRNATEAARDALGASGIETIVLQMR